MNRNTESFVCHLGTLRQDGSYSLVLFKIGDGHGDEASEVEMHHLLLESGIGWDQEEKHYVAAELERIAAELRKP